MWQGSADNEVILDAYSYVAHLPHSILAVFVPIDGSGAEDALVRRVKDFHAKLRAAYGEEAEGIPLLEVDPSAPLAPLKEVAAGA